MVLKDEYTQMEMLTNEYGRMTQLKEKENIPTKMEQYMKEIGSLINNQVKDQRYGKMMPDMKENIKMEKNIAQES